MIVKRSKESLARTGGYKLYKQREGTRVTYWPDPRGPGHGTMLSGVVIDHMGDTVSLVWDHDDEYYETWSSGECRYRVDRGQMRFIPPPKERRIRLPPDQLICKSCGRPRQLKCGCPRAGALKPEEWGQKVDHALLTPSLPHDMMDILIGGNAPDKEMMKGATMAKRQTKAVAVVEEDEAVELEELEDEAEEATEGTEGSGDMLTAKAAASKLGTDGRTLRKFLRSKHGTIGQGQRWEIDANDIDALKAEFLSWGKGGTKADKPKTDKPKTTKKEKVEAAEEIAPDAAIDEEFDAIEDLDFGDDD